MLSSFRNLLSRIQVLPRAGNGMVRMTARRQSGGAGIDWKALRKDWRVRGGAAVAVVAIAACAVERGDDIRKFVTNLVVWKTENKISVADNMCEVFEKGGIAGWDKDNVKSRKNVVPRPDELDKLKRLLSPAETEDVYAVVVGASGTGKTTAILNAIRALEGSVKGVVYFHAPETAAEFATGLAAALDFRTASDSHTPAAPEGEPEHTWKALKPELEEAAFAFQTKHKRPAVLVLDGMDLIAKDKPAFFTRLQKFAKKGADKGWLFVIFAFSDGTAPLLLTDSSKSRAFKPIEIGDISDEKAVKYLTEKFSLDPQRAGDLVKYVTGGRFALMNLWGRDRDTPLDDIRHELNVDTNDVLTNVAKVPPTANLFRALVSSPSKALDADVAHQLEDMDKVKVMLKENIIAHHPNKTYTFHNRHVELFIREKVDKQQESEQQQVKTELA